VFSHGMPARTRIATGKRRQLPTAFKPATWAANPLTAENQKLRRDHDRLTESGILLHLVESAMLLASLRRLVRPSDLPPLPPIRSLAYFQPVIEELLVHPMPERQRNFTLRASWRLSPGSDAGGGLKQMCRLAIRFSPVDTRRREMSQRRPPKITSQRAIRCGSGDSVKRPAPVTCGSCGTGGTKAVSCL
jgi:hypothetical protein